LKDRLARIERGETGWQGTAWALERIYPKRFSRPDIQLAQQINVDTNPLVSSLSMRSCLTLLQKAIRSFTRGNDPQANESPAFDRSDQSRDSDLRSAFNVRTLARK
jgi:hypothetical protein